jgi:hypothetical protein
MANPRVPAEEHLAIDTRRNANSGGDVTSTQANAPAVGGPPAEDVRVSDVNGPGVLPAGAVRRA